MQKKGFLKVFAALGALVIGQAVHADLTTDSQQSAQWFSKEFGEMMAFQAASTHFLPGDTVGFPGVEIGVAGALTSQKLDVKGFRSLSFTTLNNSQVTLPASVPAPVGVIHAKAGLPGGWDLGVKGGSTDFNKTSGSSKTKFKNKIVGVEVRKNLLGGLAFPDLSLSLGYDRATGNATRTQPYNAPVLTGGTLIADTAWKSSWNVGAITARAVVSKKLVFITPFAGVGITKMTGDADTTADIAVTGGSSGLSSTTAKGTAKAKASVGHALAGVELSFLPFMRLNVSGLVAKDRWAASAGLRVQFP